MNITFIVLIDHKGDYIEECLKSICNEFFIDSEIVIINSNCTIENMKIVKDYKNKNRNMQVIDVKNENEKYKIINNNIISSKGEYIIFLQDIDYIDISGLLILQNEAINKKLDIVEGNIIGIEVIDQKYKLINTKKNVLNRENFTQNILYNRKFLEENNIFCYENGNGYKMLILKAQILSDLSKFVKVPCCYTRRITGKYKYKDIIENNNIGLYKLTREKNTYIELINFAKSLENEKQEKAFNIIYRSCIKYVVNEAKNYLNIDDDKKRIFECINDIINLVDFDYYKPTTYELEVIESIRMSDINKFRKLKEKIKRKNKFKRSKKQVIRQYIYGQIYRCVSLLPNLKKEVLFIENMPQVSANFKYIKKEIDNYNKIQRGRNRIKYRAIALNTTLREKILYPYYIGRANYIILAEHIPYISYLKKREKTKVIQTWHAAGAFKKFGHSTSYMPGGPNPFEDTKMELHRNYDIATVSSPEVVKYYAEAFRLNMDKVKPIGLPRADFFFDEKEKILVKESLYESYPFLKNKKVILYAPTFRGSGSSRKNFDMEFDYNRIAENISEDYVIVLKLHPSVKACDININERFQNKVFNLSEYENINDLLIITDILIADYSSVVFEYSLLERPIIFYAYDLEEYAMDRDLYYNYEEFIPGPLATTIEDVIEIINNNYYDLERVRKFGDKFFYKKDGNSSKRFLEEILLK